LLKTKKLRFFLFGSNAYVISRSKLCNASLQICAAARQIPSSLTAEGFDKHAILVISKAGADIKPYHPAGLRKQYLPAKGR
jgi:hypothetical protein